MQNEAFDWFGHVCEHAKSSRTLPIQDLRNPSFMNLPRACENGWRPKRRMGEENGCDQAIEREREGEQEGERENTKKQVKEG